MHTICIIFCTEGNWQGSAIATASERWCRLKDPTMQLNSGSCQPRTARLRQPRPLQDPRSGHRGTRKRTSPKYLSNYYMSLPPSDTLSLTTIRLFLSQSRQKGHQTHFLQETKKPSHPSPRLPVRPTILRPAPTSRIRLSSREDRPPKIIHTSRILRQAPLSLKSCSKPAFFGLFGFSLTGSLTFSLGIGL